MPLSDVELRVLGALIEKDRTTPENYPLSTQALVTACNQRTSRDPVTDLHLQEVMAAVNRLKDRGLVETIQEAGDRVPKHRHKVMGSLDLGGREVAVLAVLMLRGAQTPGELRSRTERYAEFPDVAAVESTLQRLAERSTPLVDNLGRSPGQSQDRWVHTLGVDEGRMAPRVRSARDGREVGEAEPEIRRQPTPEAPATDTHADLLRRIEALEQRVKALETRT